MSSRIKLFFCYAHKFILFRFYSNVKLHICMYLHLIVMKVQIYGLFLHINISVNLKKYNTTKWIQSRVIPGYYFKIKKNQLLKLNVKTYQFIFFVKIKLLWMSCEMLWNYYLPVALVWIQSLPISFKPREKSFKNRIQPRGF